MRRHSHKTGNGIPNSYQYTSPNTLLRQEGCHYSAVESTHPRGRDSILCGAYNIIDRLFSPGPLTHRQHLPAECFPSDYLLVQVFLRAPIQAGVRVGKFTGAGGARHLLDASFGTRLISYSRHEETGHAEQPEATVCTLLVPFTYCCNLVQCLCTTAVAQRTRTASSM